MHPKRHLKLIVTSIFKRDTPFPISGLELTIKVSTVYSVSELKLYFKKLDPIHLSTGRYPDQFYLVFKSEFNGRFIFIETELIKV